MMNCCIWGPSLVDTSLSNTHLYKFTACQDAVRIALSLTQIWQDYPSSFPFPISRSTINHFAPVAALKMRRREKKKPPPHTGLRLFCCCCCHCCQKKDRRKERVGKEEKNFLISCSSNEFLELKKLSFPFVENSVLKVSFADFLNNSHHDVSCFPTPTPIHGSCGWADDATMSQYTVLQCTKSYRCSDNHKLSLVIISLSIL